MVASYLLGLQSYHINYHCLVSVFKDHRLTQILQDKKSFFLKVRKDQFLIIKEIFKYITSIFPITSDHFNINAIFKIA